MICSLMHILHPSATFQKFQGGKHQQILRVLSGKFISSTLNDGQNAALSWFLDLYKCQVRCMKKHKLWRIFSLSYLYLGLLMNVCAAKANKKTESMAK